MAGKGLIGVNRFLEKLAEEVESINIEEINSILRQEEAARAVIRKHKRSLRTGYLSDPAIRNLEENVIPRKIEIVREYAAYLSRIKRIVELLKRRKERFLRVNASEYENLLSLLELFTKLFKEKKLPFILRKEQEALRKRKVTRFCKWSNKEYLLLRPFIHKLVFFAERIDVGAIDKLSIPGRRIRVLNNVLMVGVVFWSLMLNSAFANGYVLLGIEGGYKHCPEYPVIVQIRDQVFSKMGVIEHYQKNDFQHELRIEAEFESLTGVNLVGEYSESDITLAKDILERTYGYDILKKSGIHTLLVLPANTSLKYGGTRPYTACAGVRFSGFARGGGELVINSSSGILGKSRYTSTFLHEIAHHIHFKVQRDHPEFNQKWEQIQGGYAAKYGMKNINEDIATVIGEASLAHLKGKSLKTLRAVDGNQQALMAKINLLIEYGFFPS